MSLPKQVLAKYITKGCHFIESGTRWGDTALRAFELGAAEVWTFELDELFATLAHMHVADVLRENAKCVQVIHADSVKRFTYWNGYSPNRDVVVFLDAHTATSTPVLQELEAMKHWEVRPKTILIDDLSCMLAWGVREDQIKAACSKMGYINFSKEHGAKPDDILVITK